MRRLDRASMETPARNMRRPAGPASLDLNGEKTAAASVRSLADNLRANAADIVKAVHGAENGEARATRQVAIWGHLQTRVPRHRRANLRSPQAFLRAPRAGAR